MNALSPAVGPPARVAQQLIAVCGPEGFRTPSSDLGVERGLPLRGDAGVLMLDLIGRVLGANSSRKVDVAPDSAPATGCLLAFMDGWDSSVVAGGRGG